MCDRLLYECPRGDDKPSGECDELTPEQILEWEALLHEQNRV